jgi:hypothetical protein
MIRVTTRSPVVVSTMMVSVPGPGELVWCPVNAPGMATTIPTKHIPMNEANAQKLEVFAS